MKNFGTGQKWLEGKIAECTGPMSFLVEMEDGKLVTRHQDQLRHRKESTVLQSKRFNFVSFYIKFYNLKPDAY